MEEYENARRALREIRLMRLEINALNEKERRCRCALERLTPVYGSAVRCPGRSMEDRILDIVEIGEKRKALFKALAAGTEALQALLKPLFGHPSQAKRFLSLCALPPAVAAKQMRLSEENYDQTLRRALNALEKAILGGKEAWKG